MACPFAFHWPARPQSSSSIHSTGSSPVTSAKFEVQESKLRIVTKNAFNVPLVVTEAVVFLWRVPSRFCCLFAVKC